MASSAKRRAVRGHGVEGRGRAPLTVCVPGLPARQVDRCKARVTTRFKTRNAKPARGELWCRQKGASSWRGAGGKESR